MTPTTKAIPTTTSTAIGLMVGPLGTGAGQPRKFSGPHRSSWDFSKSKSEPSTVLCTSQVQCVSFGWLIHHKAAACHPNPVAHCATCASSNMGGLHGTCHSRASGPRALTEARLEPRSDGSD